MSKLAPPLRPYCQDGTTDYSVRLPKFGELVMIRLSFSVGGPPSIISESAISGSTGANYHLCLIVGLRLACDWALEVLICRSYSSVSDGVAYINSLPESAANTSSPYHFIPVQTPQPNLVARFPFPAIWHADLLGSSRFPPESFRWATNRYAIRYES
jgi:hypothetical protein